MGYGGLRTLRTVWRLKGSKAKVSKGKVCVMLCVGLVANGDCRAVR